MSWQFILVNGPYLGTCEGPAWDGSALLFTHIPGNRIIRYDPQDRGSSIYRADTNNANGLMFDSEGRNRFSDTTERPQSRTSVKSLGGLRADPRM